MTMLILAMLSIALPLFALFCRVAVVVFAVAFRLVLLPATVLVVLLVHLVKPLLKRKR
jgi:hypothetical protein